MNWTEKYRPKALKDVLGNPKALKTLMQWAQSWEHGNPECPGVVLSGDPGTGKTSTALALASEMGWEAIELNASDARNEDAIHKRATMGALNQTFSSEGDYRTAKEQGRKLIIFDEADNLYERGFEDEPQMSKDVSDKGGKKAIIETLAKTKHPVVLIVNDYYELTKRTGARIKSLTVQIKFSPLKTENIVDALRAIAAKEGVRVQEDVFHLIANRCAGDLRAAINDLQSECEGHDFVDGKDFDSSGVRDIRTKMFDGIYEILRAKTCKDARKISERIDETPDMFLLWIDENIPVEYKDPGDLCRAYDVLSRADVFYSRAYGKRHFNMLGYSMDLMTAGVALSKRTNYTAFNKFKLRFPSYLLKMSSSKGQRALQKAVYSKLNRYCHTSNEVVRAEIIPLFARMLKDYEHAKYLIKKAGLDKEMAMFILNEDTLPAATKQAFKDLAKEMGGEPEEDEEAEVPVEKPKKGRKKPSKDEAAKADKDEAPKTPEPRVEQIPPEPAPEPPATEKEQRKDQKTLFDY